MCIGFIENLLDTEHYSDILILDDTNFPCSKSNNGLVQFSALLPSYKLSNCDDLIASFKKNIYVNTALGHASRIDNFFATSSLKGSLYNMLVIDSGVNNSNHRPLTGCIDVKWDNTSSSQGYVKPIPNNAASVRRDNTCNKNLQYKYAIK